MNVDGGRGVIKRWNPKERNCVVRSTKLKVACGNVYAVHVRMLAFIDEQFFRFGIDYIYDFFNHGNNHLHNRPVFTKCDHSSKPASMQDKTIIRRHPWYSRILIGWDAFGSHVRKWGFCAGYALIFEHCIAYRIFLKCATKRKFSELGFPRALSSIGWKYDVVCYSKLR